jgi:hypothetical protein
MRVYVTKKEFEAQLSAGEVLTRREGGKIAGTVSMVENFPERDESSSFTVSNKQFEAMAEDNGWVVRKRAANLLAILQTWYTVPAGAT